MNEPIMNTQAQAQSYLEKAETYKKLGLKNQVQFELEQARRIDPYITQDAKYRTLLEDNVAETKKIEALKTPLRIGAGMLFVNAGLGVISLILILTSGNSENLGGGDFIAPIVNVIIGVNLWQIKVNYQMYTVWWAALGLILFGLGSLAGGDYVGLILQIGFSGSLILLLAGTPSKARTVTSVVAFVILYLGVLCLVFTLSFLSGFVGTG